MKTSWSDRFAMLIAAFGTIFLPCVLVLGLFALMVFWFIGFFN